MKIMTIRVPDHMQSALKKISANQGFTRNALVLQVLRDYLDNANKSYMQIKGLVDLATWSGDADRVKYLTRLLVRVSQMDTAELVHMVQRSHAS